MRTNCMVINYLGSLIDKFHNGIQMSARFINTLVSIFTQKYNKNNAHWFNWKKVDLILLSNRIVTM